MELIIATGVAFVVLCYPVMYAMDWLFERIGG